MALKVVFIRTRMDLEPGSKGGGGGARLQQMHLTMTM